MGRTEGAEVLGALTDYGTLIQSSNERSRARYSLLPSFVQAIAHGRGKLIAELFMWNSRTRDVVSGDAFTSLFNRAFPSDHHAPFEYGGTISSLPEGKTFESPDKTLNHLKFRITRRVGTRSGPVRPRALMIVR